MSKMLGAITFVQDCSCKTRKAVVWEAERPDEAGKRQESGHKGLSSVQNN